jgi:hypothetical protein
MCFSALVSPFNADASLRDRAIGSEAGFFGEYASNRLEAGAVPSSDVNLARSIIWEPSQKTIKSNRPWRRRRRRQRGYRSAKAKRPQCSV